MQKIHGKLLVKIVKGSRGPFAVGDLATSIGDFKIKSAILDQFEEGSYAGDFLVTRIYPRSYFFKGRTITEISADIAEVFLDTVHESTLQREQDEPDPIDLETGTTAGDDKPVVTKPAEPAPTVPRGSGIVTITVLTNDAKLFGDALYALVADGSTVKLDPTVDRALFREQRDRLKALGYKFNAQTQDWSKVSPL
jgi:Protein of unknown function (DUF3275)